MAEVLGIIGSVAAVSQLASQFVALTTSLRRALKVIRHAPEEIQSFLMDTSNFTSLLNFFAELADRAMKKAQGKERHRRERMIAGIRKQCRSVCDKIADLVGHFAALARGGMTPLEGFIERIRYLLDKPDVKDLRLSVQLAATIVNGMSTLFMWEALAKTDEQRTLYLEQLRNQLPVAREASAQLAKHQQRHGFAYESGGPDDVMLVVSKEMLRQIDRVIKPHIRPEDTGHQSPKRRRRERRRDSSVVDETDSVRRRPSSSDGLPSPSTDAASRVSEPRSGTTSPDMDTQIKPDKLVDQDREYFALNVSDPMKPRIHSCNRRCTHGRCSSCKTSHCLLGTCPYSEKTASKDGKGTPSSQRHRDRELNTSSESKEARGQHRPPSTTVESECSSPSGRNGTSRTSPARLSSKSSSSSTRGPTPVSPATAKKRDATAIRAAEEDDRGRDIPEEVAGRLETQSRPDREREQRPVQGGQGGTEARDKRPRTDAASGESLVSDDGDSDGSRQPSPYVPMAPFGGPGSRRRPRRPRPEM